MRSRAFDQARRDDLLLLYVSGQGVLSETSRLYFATTSTPFKRLRSPCSEGGVGRESNYIAGPTLFSTGASAPADKVDYRRVRAYAIAFAEMTLRRGRAPGDKLGTYTLG